MKYLIDVHEKYETFKYIPYPLCGPLHKFMYGNIQKGREMMPTVIPREVAVCGTHSGHSVVEKDVFKNNFNEFTHGLFESMQWGNLIVIGGSVVSSALGSIVGFENSDVDCYIYGILDKNEFIQKIQQIKRCLCKQASTMGVSSSVAIRTPCTITISFGYPYRSIQIITSPWQSPEHILSTCDIEPTSLGWTGSKLLSTPRARFGLNHRCLIPNNRSVNIRGGREYPTRLAKYAKRGFSVVDPLLCESHFETVLSTLNLKSKSCNLKISSVISETIIHGVIAAGKQFRGRRKSYLAFCLSSMDLPGDLSKVVSEYADDRDKKKRDHHEVYSNAGVPYGPGKSVNEIRSWILWMEMLSMTTCGYCNVMGKFELLRGPDIRLPRFQPIIDPYSKDKYHVEELQPGSEFVNYGDCSKIDKHYYSLLKVDEFIEELHSARFLMKASLEAMKKSAAAPPPLKPFLTFSTEEAIEWDAFQRGLRKLNRRPELQKDLKKIKIRKIKAVVKSNRSKTRKNKFFEILEAVC